VTKKKWGVQDAGCGKNGEMAMEMEMEWGSGVLARTCGC